MLNCTTYFAEQVMSLERAVADAARQRAEEAARARADKSFLNAGAAKSRAIGEANRQRVFDWVKAHPRCSRRDISNGTGMTFRNVGPHISRLVQDERIVNTGSRCRAAYVVVTR